MLKVENQETSRMRLRTKLGSGGKRRSPQPPLERPRSCKSIPQSLKYPRQKGGFWHDLTNQFDEGRRKPPFGNSICAVNPVT